jgi:hypothetical protein
MFSLLQVDQLKNEIKSDFLFLVNGLKNIDLIKWTLTCSFKKERKYIPEYPFVVNIAGDVINTEFNYDYFNNRLSVLDNIPLLNPLPNWNTTSTFGLRKSPTSGFWEFHDGLDMANATGTPIYAAAPGTVVRLAYSKTGYGTYFFIEKDTPCYTSGEQLNSTDIDILERKFQLTGLQNDTFKKVSITILN